MYLSIYVCKYLCIYVLIDSCFVYFQFRCNFYYLYTLTYINPYIQVYIYIVQVHYMDLLAPPTGFRCLPIVFFFNFLFFSILIVSPPEIDKRLSSTNASQFGLINECNSNAFSHLLDGQYAIRTKC